ncbi:UNVERIFIED_CONTAM: hypothetical protein Slati_1375600 [Sesamum latifolium]|uniref:ATP-dependent DNA helicase n=1 Tax=Sesamum latifolium TaxID=2727402 RepID=A0AAW2XQ85_9LAMI
MHATVMISQVRGLILYYRSRKFKSYRSSLQGFHMMIPAKELSYDRDALSNERTQLYSDLNFQQKKVYDDVIRAVKSNTGGFFFVYGSGGTGKTYLWKTIITRLSSQGKVVLAVASSGIASLLLPGGRTAHSKFKIPMIVDEDTTCRISQGTPLVDLISKASLVIWDEAPMEHRNVFEAANKIFKDIIGYTDPDAKWKVFGGKTIVLGDIWQDCKVLELTTNMRLHHSSLDPTEVETMRNFGKWALELGDGKLPAYNFDNEDEPSWIKILDNLLIYNSGDPIMDVVSSTYPDLAFKYNDPTFFRERAILAPTNEIVDEINSYILSSLSGEARKYRSSDRICPSENMIVDNQSLLYPIEFLNTLKLFQEKFHTCKATIQKIEYQYNWYYKSCQCKKVVREINSVLWCERCNREVQYPTPKYKLTVEVKDFTGGAHFVIFDKEVEKLINCSASSLLEISDKDGEQCEQIGIQAFDQLRFCTFIFQVKVTKFNTMQGSKVYCQQGY